jgi:ligand-binding sensor domain-containing protein
MIKNRASRNPILIVAFVVLALAGCCLIGYQLLLTWQIKSMGVLGWERDRYLWMASMYGVVRWDVNRQAVVNRSFTRDDIDRFFVSTGGQVWGYGEQLWTFESGKWIEQAEADGIPTRGGVHDLGQLLDGTIWAATDKGFKSWNQQKRRWESMLVDLPGTTLVQGQDGSLWFGLSQDGVIRIQAGKTTHYTTADGLINNETWSMLAARDGTIWVGTGHGVSRWDGTKWQKWVSLGYPDPDGLVVDQFYETREGTIWASTSEDLASWANGTWTSYPRSPSCFTAWAFLEIDDGSLWVGCSSGLFRWIQSGWREYGIAEGVPQDTKFHLVQGTNGVLYAAASGSGVYQYLPDQDRWQLLPIR